MTVNTSTSVATYIGAGSTGPYAYGFRIKNATQMVVTRTDVATPPITTTLVAGADYTATGLGNRTGGSVTLTVALTAGWTLKIKRIVPITQTADFRNAGTLSPEAVEDAFDTQTEIAQQIAGSGGQLTVTTIVQGGGGEGITAAGFDSDAIDVAIAAATAAGVGVNLLPGTYAVTRTAILNANLPWFRGSGLSTILRAQPGFTGSAILQYGANEGGAAKKHTTIGRMLLDANAQGVDGVVVYKSEELTIDNVFVQTARYGVYFDGQFNIRILNTLLRSCYTTACTVGYKFDGPNPQTTSFDTFLMESCASESDATGVWARGVLKNRVTLVGCELQNSSVAGLHADGTTIELIGTYIETSSGTTHPAIELVNGAVCTQDAGSSAAYPSVDATSRLLVGAGANVSVMKFSSPAVIGAADVLVGAVQLWGPPNFPVDGRGGYTAYIGQISTDAQGVRWKCTLGGNSAGAPTYPRWQAMDGEIRIPMDLTTLGNGTKLWWPQDDFVLTSAEFLPIVTATGGTYIKIGTDNAGLPQALISQAQGAVANLVAGQVVAARDNISADAVLARSGSRIVLRGTEHNAVPAILNYVGYLKSGVFATGTGVLVLRGYYARAAARGTLALVASASTPQGTRTLLDGWFQDTTVAASQAGVTLGDAVCPRGDAAQGRLMVRAGAVTAIIARLTAAKTAGTLTVVPSWSSDNGITWHNFNGLSIPNGAYSAVITFSPDLWPFIAQVMLRFQVTTDVNFLPTANDLDVGLEVTQ